MSALSSWQKCALIAFVSVLASCYLPNSTQYEGPGTLPINSYKNPWSSSSTPKRFGIKQLPGLPLVMTREVAEQHRVLSIQKRTFTSAYERREPYHQVLKQILKDEGVPETLLSLALVESGFRTDARSPYGAVGMWQFIKSSAKLYGLEVGFLTDQRKDPVLSTIAAARMLRDLYEMFDDWLLAMAAYNCGPARVERIIREGGSRDFWRLVRQGRFPQETRKFVPRVIAAAIIEQDKLFL